MAGERSQQGSKIAVASQDVGEQISCGIIMPISATTTHAESHWEDVQKLLHRAINEAGFVPKNVWESSSTDRISERIVGNIFNFPIVIADISDLNPNVMFELGLRLSSKKPTIVIANSGDTIPFDIRDFHVVLYPSDMNMLGMEEFFKKLSKSIKEKHAHFQSESYVPFLSSVIIDVASPETREVGLNELLLSRIEDISRRMAAIEVNTTAVPSSVAPRFSRRNRTSGSIELSIPEDRISDFVSAAHELFEVDDVAVAAPADGQIDVMVDFSGGESISSSKDQLIDFAKRFGGEEAVPF